MSANIKGTCYEFRVKQQTVFIRLHKLWKIQKKNRWIRHMLSQDMKRRRFDTAIVLVLKGMNLMSHVIKKIILVSPNMFLQ